MTLYEEFYPDAVELLAEFGAKAKLIRTNPASMVYDPITDRTDEQTTTTTMNVQAVVGELEWEEDEGRTANRATVLMTVKPVQGDTLTQGDMTYSIGRVSQVAPQGKAIIYFAEVD